MEKKKTLSTKMKFTWSTTSIAVAVFSILMSYATFFATDYMGLSAATVGILFMASKIFDGFTDIVCGYLIEKTHSRLGKGRPFTLAIIGYGICAIALYGAPKMGITASAIYLFVMYTLINSVFLTMLNCCDAVYMSNSLENPSDSVSLSAFQGIASMVTAIVAAVLIPQLVSGMANTDAGWLKISLIISIPTTIIGLIRFFAVKEVKQTSSSTTNISFKDMVTSITANKYIILFALIILVSNIGNGLAGNVGTYYAKYIIGDIGAQSILSLATLGAIFGVVAVNIIAKKIGLVKSVKIMTVIGLIGYLARLLAPKNILVCLISAIFASMAFTVMFSFVAAFIIDCMDYGEWKSGKRNEGAIACAQSVTAKIGTAIGSGLVGILMGMSGYNGTLEVQTASANNMLIAMATVLPAAFCVLQLVLFHFYDLDKKLPQIRKDLEERHQA